MQGENNMENDMNEKAIYFAGIKENTKTNSLFYTLQRLIYSTPFLINFGDDLWKMGKYAAEEFGNEFRERVSYNLPFLPEIFCSIEEDKHLKNHHLSRMEIKLFEKSVLENLERETCRRYTSSKVSYKDRKNKGWGLGCLFDIESAKKMEGGGEKENFVLGLKRIDSINGKRGEYNYTVHGLDLLKKLQAELGAVNNDELVGKKVVGFFDCGGKSITELHVLH